MKKPIILLSMIAALVVTGCQTTPSASSSIGDDISDSASENTSNEDSSSQKTSSSSQKTSSSSSSSQSSNSSSSWRDDYVPPEPHTYPGDNFTINIPADLSSMSANCKKYVDDMRAQQRKLIGEKGANADYYLNDLYGTNGVDLTKGITSGDNGGYRPANVQNDYLDSVTARWEDGQKSDENKGINITFIPSYSLQNKEYTITYGKNADLSDAETISQSETTVNLKNLLVNQKYYFKVSADGKDSDVVSFTTGDYPRWIDARPMFNVRDHGGYMTSSGQRIKQGMVYRGGEITPAVNWKSGSSYTGDVGGRYTGSDGRMQDGHITTQTNKSKEVFRNVMGMVGGLEIDLRSGASETGPSAQSYTACGFANSGDIAYQLWPISSYANGLNNSRSNIKKVFDAIAQADTKPVYYHCYGGADRTGTVGFLLGAMLGMSYTDLVIDFELTTYSSNPSRNYRSHLRNGPYNKWPEMVTALKNNYGFSSSKTIKQAAEDYLKNQCSVSQTTINKIRSIMLEPAEQRISIKNKVRFLAFFLWH